MERDVNLKKQNKNQSCSATDVNDLFQDLTCDWSKDNYHSTNSSTVHGFLSLTVMFFIVFNNFLGSILVLFGGLG